MNDQSPQQRPQGRESHAAFRIMYLPGALFVLAVAAALMFVGGVAGPISQTKDVEAAGEVALSVYKDCGGLTTDDTDQEFSFNLDGTVLGTTVGCDETVLIANINLTTGYNLREVVPDDWSLTPLSTGSCVTTSGSGIVYEYEPTFAEHWNVRIATGGSAAEITCTFENSRLYSTITVSKEYDDDNTDPVSVTVYCNNADVNGQANSDTQDVDPETAGTVFQITNMDGADCDAMEIVPDGYFGDVGECDWDPVEEGQDYSCTIYNYLNELTFLVHKDYEGGGDKPDATIHFYCDSGDVSPSSATAGVGHDAYFTVTGFSSPVYCWAEEEPVPGYYQTDNNCYGSVELDGELPDGYAAISAELELVDFSCEITNTLDPASITIIKSVPGTSDAVFGFLSNIDGCGNFDLSDNGVSGDDRVECHNLDSGDYNVREGVTPGNWVLDSISCNGGDVDTDEGNESVVIHLDDGDHVVCTFTNIDDTRPPTVIIPPASQNVVPTLPTQAPTPAPTATPGPTGGVGGIQAPNTGDAGLLDRSATSDTWFILVGLVGLIAGAGIWSFSRQR